jgi:hypothetical protein
VVSLVTTGRPVQHDRHCAHTFHPTADIRLAHNELRVCMSLPTNSNFHACSTHPFTSFVRALDSHVSLVSFHSISKGVTGECSTHGGCFECANIDDDTIALIYKMVFVWCDQNQADALDQHAHEPDWAHTG